MRNQLRNFVQFRQNVVESLAARRQVVAAAQAGLKQLHIPTAGGERTGAQRLPDCLALERLYRHDSGLTAAPPLHHALERLQHMKIVTVDAAHAEADRFLDLRAQRCLHIGETEGKRNGGSRHEGESHVPGGFNHLQGPFPLPRKMFVVEDRRRAATGSKYVDDLAEKLVSRIEGLSLFIHRVLAVLGDEQDTIEREAATTEGQSLGNRRVNLYPREAPDSLMAQVAGSDLVDVQGDEIHRRLV